VAENSLYSNLLAPPGIYSVALTETRRFMAAVATLEATTPSGSHRFDADAARAASGDRQAFERLYRKHLDRIFSLCARMVSDRTRAEELTQDVFVRAWEKLKLFRGESSFATWLHRLAVNVVLNDRKTEGRRRSRFEEEDEEQGMDRYVGVVGMVLPPGDLLDLEKAITRLPPGARRVFTLHDVEGYKHEEIAEMLGVTTGATKAQLHRARMLLREALNR
jgi:RNA polymerase sigma-70 factor (ECF subfamily)